MMWSRARATVVALLAFVDSSSFGSAFVAPLPNHGSTSTSSKTSPTLAAIAPRRTRLASGSQGRGKGVGIGAEQDWGGVLEARRSRGEENGEGVARVQGGEERGHPARPQPVVGAPPASTVSGLAAGAAIVALAALGGFPDLAAAAAPAWVGPTKLVLDPILLYFEVAFVARIILSWYPKLDLNSVPQNLVAWPTEPILRPTRAVIPPAFGVDISPIVWVMICSLIHEILLGQQGILNLMSNK
eukprot:g6480.t1